VLAVVARKSGTTREVKRATKCDLFILLIKLRCA
jgi:hypothetical protein